MQQTLNSVKVNESVLQHFYIEIYFNLFVIYPLFGFITAQCTLVQMRGIGIACRPPVCPSVVRR